VCGISSSKPEAVDGRGQRQRAALVGGISDSKERLTGVGRDRQHADVVDDHEVGAD
jgi:hypothetical protein